MRRLPCLGRLALLLALQACAAKNAVVPVGGACSSDDVCLTGSCIQATDLAGKATRWRDGYCSGNCDEHACPQGRCLTMADDSKLCVADCGSDGDCRAGYVCDQTVKACLPDCREGWSCGTTLVCNADNGSCQLPKGTAPVGDACTTDNDCANGFCIRDADASGWTDGYCSADCASDDCPQGSCLTMADASKLCVATCATDSDCRAGYVCAKAAAACLPDCRRGWSCGATLTCNSTNGNCQSTGGPSASP